VLNGAELLFSTGDEIDSVPVTGGPAVALFSNQRWATNLALDRRGDLFWVSSQSGVDAIEESPGSDGISAPLGPSASAIDGLTLVLDVPWWFAGGNIMKADLSGNQVTARFAAAAPQFAGMVGTSTGEVYFGSGGWLFAVSNGPATAVFQAHGTIRSLVGDDERLVWVDDAGIEMLPHDAQQYVKVTDGSPLSMALDGDRLYTWTIDPSAFGELVSVDLADGTRTVLAREDENCLGCSMAFDATAIYWGTSHAVRRLAK
jgi:hypothetical protein